MEIALASPVCTTDLSTRSYFEAINANLPAFQALPQQIIVAKSHGGLDKPDYISTYVSKIMMRAYAARSRLIVVLNPSVAVRLP